MGPAACEMEVCSSRTRLYTEAHWKHS